MQRTLRLFWIISRTVPWIRKFQSHLISKTNALLTWKRIITFTEGRGSESVPSWLQLIGFNRWGGGPNLNWIPLKLKEYKLIILNSPKFSPSHSFSSQSLLHTIQWFSHLGPHVPHIQPVMVQSTHLWFSAQNLIACSARTSNSLSSVVNLRDSLILNCKLTCKIPDINRQYSRSRSGKFA